MCRRICFWDSLEEEGVLSVIDRSSIKRRSTWGYDVRWSFQRSVVVGTIAVVSKLGGQWRHSVAFQEYRHCDERREETNYPRTDHRSPRGTSWNEKVLLGTVLGTRGAKLVTHILTSDETSLREDKPCALHPRASIRRTSPYDLSGVISFYNHLPPNKLGHAPCFSLDQRARVKV